MLSYRIHRLKDHLRQQFRFAPHTSGRAQVKPRDYTASEEWIEAASPYAAFFQLKQSEEPLELGDLLETREGTLRIFKFVGFEEAEWVPVEVKAPPAEAPLAAQ